MTNNTSINGKLIALADSSLNGNLSLGKDLTINGNLYVNQYRTKQTITTLDYSTVPTLAIAEDLSMSGTLKLTGNAFMSGSVGIGTNSPQAPLNTYGYLQTNTTSTANYYTQLTHNQLQFCGVGAAHYSIYNDTGIFKITNTTAQVALGTIGTPVLCITNSNNVGIGTTNPASTLHIYEANGNAGSSTNGSLTIQHGNTGGASSIIFPSRNNATSDYGYITYQDDTTINGAGENALLCIGTENDAGSDHLILQKNGGNVGIGTNNPAQKLHVNGPTMIYPESGGDPLFLRQPFANNGVWWLQFLRGSTGVVVGRVEPSGTSNVIYSTNSDGRLKTNVQPMSSMINKIKQLKPSHYTWKDGNEKGDGFIAQEVHKVFPQFIGASVCNYCDSCDVSINDIYDGNLCECCDWENPMKKDGTMYTYGIDYGKFTPYLTKALQEVIEITENQQTQIDALVARLAALENK